MSEQKNSFLYIGEDGKADWGVPEGYPYDGFSFNPGKIFDTEEEKTAATVGGYIRIYDTVFPTDATNAKIIGYPNWKIMIESYDAGMYLMLYNSNGVGDEIGTIVDSTNKKGYKPGFYVSQNKYGKSQMIIQYGEFKKLDAKFLPYGYPYEDASTVLEEQTKIFPSNGQLIISESILIIADAKYKVIWDDIEYECTALGHDNYRMLGDPDQQFYPFAFSYDGTTTAILSTPGEHTFSISKIISHRMSAEFMPLLTSPNGTKYKLTVSDDGALSAVAMP